MLRLPLLAQILALLLYCSLRLRLCSATTDCSLCLRLHSINNTGSQARTVTSTGSLRSRIKVSFIVDTLLALLTYLTGSHICNTGLQARTVVSTGSLRLRIKVSFIVDTLLAWLAYLTGSHVCNTGLQARSCIYLLPTVTHQGKFYRGYPVCFARILVWLTRSQLWLAGLHSHIY